MDLTAVKRVDFRIRAKRLQEIDIRKGRIFSSFGENGGTVDLEDPEGNAFNHIISNMTV
jgi:hypothetical protein